MGIIARQGIKASIVGLIGVAIGAFSRLFLYTKFLTVSEIGVLETVIKLGMLLVPLFIFGAPQVITKFYPQFATKKDDSGLVFTYAKLILFILIPFFTIVYLFSKNHLFALYTHSPELIEYYLLPLLVAIFFGLFTFIRSISVVYLRIVVPNILGGIVDRLIVAFLLIMYGYFQLINTYQFIYLNIILFFFTPFFFMVLYIIYIIKPKLKNVSLKESINILKVTSKYNIYLIFGTASSVIIAAIDVNMISGQLGVAFSGIYTIAFYIGTVIEIPRRNITNIAFPILNQAYIEKRFKDVEVLYKKTALNQLLVGFFFFAIVWFNIDQIFSIIPNGDVYKTGKLVVLFIGISKLIDMGTGVNSQIIEASSYYKYNLFVGIILSILLIIFNLFFIKLDSPYIGGINGVAFATLLAILVSNFLSVLIVQYKEGMHPFSINLLKCFIPITILFVFNHFLDISNSFLSIAISSTFTILIFITSNYIFRISEDFNLLLHKLLKSKK